MKHTLEAVERDRAELRAVVDECQARLELLDKIVEMAGDLIAGAPPAPEPEPAPTPRASRPRRRELGPALRSTPQRRQKAAPAPAEQVRVIHDLVTDLEPVRLATLVDRAPFGLGQTRLILHRLRDAGVVRSTGKSRGARWHLTATLDAAAAELTTAKRNGAPLQRCRAEVLSTVRLEPNAWTEQRIAEAGAFDREQVAEACGQLLVDGLVLLNADGTYRLKLQELTA